MIAVSASRVNARDSEADAQGERLQLPRVRGEDSWAGLTRDAKLQYSYRSQAVNLHPSAPLLQSTKELSLCHRNCSMFDRRYSSCRLVGLTSGESEITNTVSEHADCRMSKVELSPSIIIVRQCICFYMSSHPGNQQLHRKHMSQMMSQYELVVIKCCTFIQVRCFPATCILTNHLASQTIHVAPELQVSTSVNL